MTPADAHLPPLEGADNFRDVGPPPGRLFRSATLQMITRDDARLLAGDLGITAVLDLRTAEESTGYARPVLAPATRYANVPLHDVHEPPHGPGDLLGRIYREHLRHDPNLPIALDLLAMFLSHGPTIVHCAAGKDRTGMVVALALGLAGAPRDHIVRDYMLSGPAMPRVVDRLRRLPRYRHNMDRLPASVYECRSSSILMLLDSIEAHYGSFHGWARSAGVSDVSVAALRAALMPGPSGRPQPRNVRR
ncbi:hypothetical protein DP939_33580 [Spongiactinospora rosea]|uniref:Tyrosine specific protein phosphatases domain-containing protein n=1 Tax=Spongiactinospora rosea TaxID=2248750 RepID=A0A366LRK2_9ACTN|nr:tyrosine-protein phosphatase [Spongiactinospora rosea]RBQ15934.1 hypothetical protein DP939_33580 [Spongiactinospora rosea]